MPCYFGGKAFTEIIIPLIEGKALGLSAAKLNLRKRWRTNLFSQHPLTSLRRGTMEKWYKLARLVKPPGFSIAILGTDGSGKSTIIDQITSPLETALHNTVRYEHMRPNLLPSIAQLFGRPTSNGPVTNPHASKSSGFIGSILRLGYYSIDYILGYWLKVHIDKARRSCLWIFDRYFYDYQIDPRRGRINLPQWVIQMFSYFIPKPNLVLCLGADPEVIQKRKPELPLVEVKRQVTELQRFCAKTKNAVWIDTGCKLEQSVDQALTAIISAMAARYKQQ